jgi:hypothetical protein
VSEAGIDGRAMIVLVKWQVFRGDQLNDDGIVSAGNCAITVTEGPSL